MPSIINARFEYHLKALKIILSLSDGQEGVLWKRKNGFAVYSQSGKQTGRKWLANFGACDPEFEMVKALWNEKNLMILKYRNAGQRFTPGKSYYF